MELRTLLLLGVSLVHSSVIQPHDVLAPSAPSIVVNTPLGTVSGWERVSRDGRPYLAWTRIPFAQPPVGKLRFMITLDNAPVLVYVHGGGFQVGYGGAPGNADYIMDEDVILVSIQYRVNGFGFMTLGDKIMPGNYGLKDQAMALKWVKQNIASFGGNPNSITAFGGSAGGASTHYLLKSPVCDDIVTRAVSDSGTINHIWSLGKVDFERQSTMAVVNEVGCTSEDHSEILTCLQGIPASQLMSAIQHHYPDDPSRLTYLPVIEPEDAEDAFMTEDLSLRPSTKPWITSTTNGEYELIANWTHQSFLDRLQQNLTEYLREWILTHNDDPMMVNESATMLEVDYFKDRVRTENMRLEFAKFAADYFFVFPVVFNMIHRGPKWMYRFEYKGEYSGIDPATGKTWTPPNVAGHAEERMFYFNSQPTKQNAADEAVSRRLIKYLVNFAYYDNPTLPGSPYTWNQFTHNEIWRITSQGDFQGDEYYAQQILDTADKLTYILGWN
ncbi:hypothetical protein GE061_008345 [Apolygus lucorum]|uniref:Carboxylesterase type B domain-containing protein n=1 Tax=Apolygus lucorum TaxID=248454 RepID=A0A6A4IW80_APOLU|nr:hypothetical protein GE061_008345 [Apolygus lucorum]